MKTIETKLPREVGKLRTAIYHEVLALGAALGIKAYYVHKQLSLAGEAIGLGYLTDDYKKLAALLPSLLDKRYFHLAKPETELEYPFPQLRVCVNGSSMELAQTAELAMHQGVYINLYLLAVPALLSGLQERNYSAVQKKIVEVLQACSDKAIDEAQLSRLIQKRSDIMMGGADPFTHIKYYQLFPFVAEDYKVARIKAEELVLATRAPDEDVAGEWSDFVFDVPDDLIQYFDLSSEEAGLGEEKATAEAKKVSKSNE